MQAFPVVVFAEPGLVDLASPVCCFKIESNGLRIATFTILPAETVCIAGVDDVGS
jgi:hypothetical protein